MLFGQKRGIIWKNHDFRV